MYTQSKLYNVTFKFIFFSWISCLVDLTRVSEKAKKTYYKIILNEAQNIVEFIGKKHLLNIKIIKDRLLLVVTPDINLQAIKARYGSQAFYKITKDDIKIAIYIPFIIKNAKNKNKQGILY